jgi:hypothetical protein
MRMTSLQTPTHHDATSTAMSKSTLTKPLFDGLSNRMQPMRKKPRGVYPRPREITMFPVEEVYL